MMVNAKHMIKFIGGAEVAVRTLFRDRKESPVGMVRIAAHFAELDGCRPIC